MRAAALAILALGAVVGAQDSRPGFDPKAFAAYAEQAGASAAQVAEFTKDSAGHGAAQAAENLLRKLHKSYDAAAALAEKGAPEAALELTKVLGASAQDAYLTAHARYRLARVFLDGDDPEAAAQVLDEYQRSSRNLTPLDVEAAYFFAHALAKVPDVAKARLQLAEFAKTYKETAPERYLAAAKQQLAELELQGEIPLYEVADKMKSAERHIKKTDTGKETQEKQKWVLTKLEELIKLAEEQEQQSSGAPGGLNKPSAPANKSAVSPGETHIGNLNKVSGVADRWGMMKDRDRKAIETDVQTKIPGRYQKMLEEYYKRLGKSGR